MSRPFCPATARPLLPTTRFAALRSSWDSPKSCYSRGKGEDYCLTDALTARLPARPKHSLLSPVMRNKKVATTETLTARRPLVRLKHTQSLSGLQKGFNLLNSLYSPIKQPSKPSPLLDEPRKDASMPEIPMLFTNPKALQPQSALRISAYRSEPSSASVFFSKEPSSPGLRRQASIRMEVPVPSPPEPTETRELPHIWKEQVLIPVLKIQQIDAAELSNSSCSSDEPVAFIRSSPMRRSTLIQRTMTTVQGNSQSPHRESLSWRKSQEVGREIKAEYQMETADMLSNTKFRIKSRKSTYVVPQRLLKGL